MTSRREFVYAVTALAGTAAGAAAIPARAIAQGARASDPLTVEILRQMADAFNRSALAPEAALRQHASALRMFAALGVRDGLDNGVIAALQRAIRTRGRDGFLLDGVGDTAHYRRQLAALGIDVRRINFSRQLDLPGRDKALSRLLAIGPVAFLREHASTIEKLAQEAARFVPVRQEGHTKADQECQRLKNDLFALELQMTTLCLFTLVTGWPETCVIYTIGYYAFKTYIREYKQCDA